MNDNQSIAIEKVKQMPEHQLPLIIELLDKMLHKSKIVKVTDLKEMSTDPEIQLELEKINNEFEPALLDGLQN